METLSVDSITTEEERLCSANEFIKVIASCGRKFFEHKGFVSKLELSPTKRVFFIDYYTKRRIYTHRRYCRWKGFTSGGTLKGLIESLRDFIKKGRHLNANYFCEKRFSDSHPWGYGKDLQIVRKAALELGIAK